MMIIIMSHNILKRIFLVLSCADILFLNNRSLKALKGEFQICPRMDFDNNLYVEYLRYNNYKNEIILFLKGR